MSIRRELPRFLAFGLAGLGVDLASFAILQMLLADAIARIGSILTAMTTTWLLNRTFTFARLTRKTIWREYTEYVSASALGAVVNYVVFLALRYTLPPFAYGDYVHIAISSVIAAGVNFCCYKWLVFREK